MMSLLGSGDPLHHIMPRAEWTVGGITLFSNQIFMQWLAAALLIWLVPAAVRAWRDQSGFFKGFGNAIEALCLTLREMIFRPSLGNYTDVFAPYLWSLFFFLLVSNALGLLPIGELFGLMNVKFIGGTSTGNIWVTGTFASITLILVVYFGLRYHGGNYVKHFFMGPWWLSWFIALLEIAGLLFKTVALAVRLFANMIAGHIILAVLLAFIPAVYEAAGALGASGVSVAVVFGSVMFLLLEVLVAFLHAFIFTTLTAVFLGLAVNIHHDDEHHEEGAHAGHAAAH